MKRVYERDELSYGLRADVKTRALREIRWFGGRFRETVVYSHEARYRASRDAAAPEGRDVKVKETTNFELIYVVPEPRFTHWRIGGDVLDISKFALGHGVTADVKRFGVDFSWGDTDHLITGAIVGDRIFEAQELLEAGVQGVLNRFFTDTPDAMAPGLAFGPQTQDSERTRRLQFALDGQLTLTALPNKPTIALTTNFRYYGYRTTTVSPLALRWTHDLTVRVTSKLWKRLQGVCAVDFQNAHIRTDAPNSFKHIRFELGFALPVVLKFGNGRTAG